MNTEATAQEVWEAIAACEARADELERVAFPWLEKPKSKEADRLRLAARLLRQIKISNHQHTTHEHR